MTRAIAIHVCLQQTWKTSIITVATETVAEARRLLQFLYSPWSFSDLLGSSALVVRRFPVPFRRAENEYLVSLHG
jgi:hypothetical protein